MIISRSVHIVLAESIINLIAAATITIVTKTFNLFSFMSRDSLAPKIPPAKAPIDNNNA